LAQASLEAANHGKEQTKKKEEKKEERDKAERRGSRGPLQRAFWGV